MKMWPLIYFSLLVVVNANPYGCPTNVTCVEKETCCETNTGLWACCPMEDGICCNDGLHCCSKGQICLPQGNCSQPSSNQIYPSFPLRNKEIYLNSVQCPDGSSCPDGNTCCELSSGQYGCCPIVDAVCCSDHLHCCPSGHTCDVEHSRCKKKFCSNGQCDKDIFVPLLKKTGALQKQQKNEDLSQLFVSSSIIGDILCPDASSTCSSTSTCCTAVDGTWGCCPIEKALCCSDHIHCCPAHYQCDLHVFKCDHNIFGSIPMLKKEASLRKVPTKIIKMKSNFESLRTIQCPDEKSYCPEETTCCELENGSYGCCPFNKASCCSDKIHCCGDGYSCDDGGKRCIRHFNLNQTDSIPSSKKFKSLNKIQPFKELIIRKDTMCPDGITKCSLNSTCCPNKGSNNQITYSCCPYTKGVCCGSNGSVCCPNAYTCNEDQLSCQLNNLRLLRREAPDDSDYNQCGTSDVACSQDQTCCRTYGTSDGEYACCAFPDAQCCEDGRHCCARGSTCDIKSGGCVQDY